MRMHTAVYGTHSCNHMIMHKGMGMRRRYINTCFVTECKLITGMNWQGLSPVVYSYRRVSGVSFFYDVDHAVWRMRG